MSTNFKISLNLKENEFSRIGAFLKDILGGEIHDEPGLSVLRLLNNNLLELFGPGAHNPPYLFKENNTVLSFRVPNLNDALLSAEKAGFQKEGKVEYNMGSHSYCHVKSADGLVIGLFQDTCQ